MKLYINIIIIIFCVFGFKSDLYSNIQNKIVLKVNNEIITEVTSPTFNILNEYQIKKIKINHYDLYRLNSADELKNLNLFDDKLNSITLIEWPQKIIEKPKQLIELSFEYAKDYKKRFVQVKGLSL